MKKIIVVIFLTLGILFGVTTPISSFAISSGDKVKIYNYGAFNASGHRYNHGTSTSGTGISMIDINGKKHNKAWGYLDVIKVGSSSGPIAYCIQMGTSLGKGDYSTEDISFNDLWIEKLSYSARHYISLITLYGYHNNSYGAHWVDAYAATQCLLWEFSLNFRISPDGFNNPQGYAGNQIYNLTIKGTPAETVYNNILTAIKEHEKIPNFASDIMKSAPVHEMTWNSSTNRCEYRVPTSQIGSYKFTTLPTGVQVTTSGSDTVFYTTSEVDASSGVVTLKKNLPDPPDDLLVFTSPDAQACIAGTAKDPVAGYFKLKSEIRGNAKIVKTSEDGVINNILFHISGNGIDQDVRSESDGSILVENLRPGVYTVTEATIDRYKPQESRQVTVVSGQTSTVTFNNVLKRGNLEVIKSAEDKFNEGHKFRLSGTSLSGHTVNQYAVTDSSGKAVFRDVLISGSTPYTIEEVDTAVKYVVPENQSTAIKWNDVTHATFINKLKKFNLHVKKTDSKTGTAQGDATLANAKYGLFQNGILVDEYYTDIFGEFDTKTYICGDNWTLKELEPSTGYLLNPTEYSIGAEAGKFTIEYNPISLGVTEDVIMGSVVLVKHSDNGGTQIETPEVGATFEIYLTKAGSYGKAKSSERDLLVIDKNGFTSSTHQLPYGWYTIRQKDGWENAEKIEDFQVFIGKHNEVYYYILNNAPITAKVKIEKRDAETGKLIATNGIGFKLYDPTGKQIVQHYDYPYPTDVEVYYINESGWLMLPEPLAYGKGYKLVEVQTAEPYYLSPEPVYFDVDGSETTVTVTKYNKIQMGKIHIDKFGEVFADIIKSGDIYQPVYEVQSLAGAVVDFYAADDIIINGDVKVRKDTLVSTITTDENGADTDLLYPGLYYYIERVAPYSMTSNSKKHFVEIVYAGQTVEVSLTSVSIFNERQKAKITLEKFMEPDNAFGIGMNNELSAVRMGLYADSDIKATNGKTIPKDGLIEIISISENGIAVFSTDIPVGAKLYVKEIATDQHYLLSDEKFPVVFEYEGQNIAVVHLQLNDGNPIHNDIIRSRIEGNKINENGERLSRAIIGLFKPSENDFTKENAILTTESAEDGGFSFEDVPFGNWICREIAAPSGYVLSDKIYPVAISEQGETIEIEIENRYIRGSVKTTKVDAEYPDNNLNGVVFDIYLDVNGNGIYDEGIDTYFGSLTETEVGVYQLDDIVFGGYFLHEKQAPKGFVKDDGFYYFEIIENGVLVEVENEAGIGFTNRPIIGELWLTKTDVSTGELIPNCGIRIKDENGNIVVEGRTDENGVVKFKLRAGKYTYSEFDCEGYELDTSAFPFEITEDGQIIKAEMTNKPLPIPTNPKTGDNTNVSLWIGIAAVAVGGLISILILRKKK